MQYSQHAFNLQQTHFGSSHDQKKKSLESCSQNQLKFAGRRSGNMKTLICCTDWDIKTKSRSQGPCKYLPKREDTQNTNGHGQLGPRAATFIWDDLNGSKDWCSFLIITDHRGTFRSPRKPWSKWNVFWWVKAIYFWCLKKFKKLNFKSSLLFTSLKLLSSSLAARKEPANGHAFGSCHLSQKSTHSKWCQRYSKFLMFLT